MIYTVKVTFKYIYLQLVQLGAPSQVKQLTSRVAISLFQLAGSPIRQTPSLLPGHHATAESHKFRVRATIYLVDLFEPGCQIFYWYKVSLFPEQESVSINFY